MQNVTNRNIRDPNKFGAWDKKSDFSLEMQVNPEDSPPDIYVT